ncbi:uncharacterized protein LOC103514058 [Diaphorina citri]|uniref:Uncharacterized protein LOC103514058 n=1 Tax=Diaphorina citri TaxID=121845 RepID=A0A1S3D9D7_DIACI|nr:uncharacterized protein LOC103514058 [Diaphorina citri]
MIKDLKFTKQGVPIVGLPILVQDFLQKTPELKVTLDTFLEENNASFLVLMGQTISGDTIRRDLGLYSPNSDTQLDHVIEIDNISICITKRVPTKGFFSNPMN